jgi:hypothetical protein
MSDVTPGADCFATGAAGAAAAGEWFALDAAAFVPLLALDDGAASVGTTFDRVAEFGWEPAGIYGWPAGVIAGSWFVSLAPG